jgi:hypothetical protein
MQFDVVESMNDYLVAIMQLIRILSRIDEVALYIGSEMGLLLIQRVMKWKPLSIELQINCSACMANLASVGTIDYNQEPNRTRMLEDGSIVYVLENMDKVHEFNLVSSFSKGFGRDLCNFGQFGLPQSQCRLHSSKKRVRLDFTSHESEY